MTEQWGAPLTGAQMKLLRAAGLGDFEVVQDKWGGIGGASHFSFAFDHYRMQPDHPAYTLLEAGWLDGRNVRLWFGGDKAPDDWDGMGVLLADGFVCDRPDEWSSSAGGRRIIAYIAKADAKVDPAADNQDAVVSFLHSSGWEGNRDVELALQLFVEDYATIAKMTEAECTRLFENHSWDEVSVFKKLGLIKEPTRAERFTAATGIAVTPEIAQALEFER